MEIPSHPVSAATRLFAVLGSPVRHSLSPAMHNTAFRVLGMDAVYVALEIAPERLAEALPVLESLGFAGVNLTIPHKQIAFQTLRNLDESARLAGGVNTLQFTPGGIVGHSTDGYGVRMAVQEAFDTGLRGEVVAVLGCGGAGRAAALCALDTGCAALWLWNRTRSRAEDLAREAARRAPGIKIHVVADPSDLPAAAIVIQASSAGLHGDDGFWKPEHFQPRQVVLDMIYTAPETPAMRAARAAGARAVNGLGMLLHQGARSLEIWTGAKPPVAAMREALLRAAARVG